MPRAFVAMPFAQQFYPVYLSIREAAMKLGISVFRIDEIWAREDIYKQIEEEILQSDLVIADFTGDRMLDVANPNVVHEAAFARVNKKYLIILAQDHKCLPFDWRTRPAIIYQPTEEGLHYLQERLQAAIQAIMQKQDFGRDYAAMGYSQPLYNMPASVGTMPSPGLMPNVAMMPSSPTSAFDCMENILRSRQQPGAEESGQPEPVLPKGFHAEGDFIICETDQSKMKCILAATFLMGGEEDDDQKPLHKIQVSGYLIDVFAITNEQYEKFVQVGGYVNEMYWCKEGWAWLKQSKIQRPAMLHDAHFNAPQQPVVGVSWYEAFAYAVWAGKHLPTEAQWEYASRGSDQRPYPWGNAKPSRELANYKGILGKPNVLGQFANGISPNGCHDMAGNVWEWCYDWYDPAYYATSPSYNPLGPQHGKDKVCRGGSWSYDPDTLKTYYRFFGAPTLRNQSYGFRCARTL